MKIIQFVRKSNLIKNAGIYTIFNIADKAIPFLIIPIITRLLPIEEVGYYTLYQAIFNILIPVLTLSIDSSILLNYFKLEYGEFKRYFTHGIILFLFFYLITFILVSLASNSISNILEFPATWLQVTMLIIVFQFFNTLRKNLWQVKKQALKFGVFSVLLTLLKNLSGLAIIYFFSYGWQGIILGHLIGALILALYSIFTFLREKLFVYNFNNLIIKDIIKIGGPLSLHSIGTWLSNSVNRIIISSLIGKAAVGSFGIGATFGMVLTVIQVAVNNAYVPYLFDKLKTNFQKDKILIIKITYLYYIAIIAASVALSLFGYNFVGLIFGEEYSETKKFIIPIIFASAFNGMYKMHVNYLFFIKKTFEIAKITLFSGCTNVILSYLMIQEWGFMGAAYSTLFIQILTYILTFYRSNFFFPMPWFYFIHKNKITLNDIRD